MGEVRSGLGGWKRIGEIAASTDLREGEFADLVTLRHRAAKSTDIN